MVRSEAMTLSDEAAASVKRQRAARESVCTYAVMRIARCQLGRTSEVDQGRRSSAEVEESGKVGI